MKKILRERKDGGVSPCSASEENVGKKKCCHIAVGAATIATVLGTSLLVYNAVKVDKSLDDVPVESNNNTTTEQLTTESAKKENVTSKQTHALTREYKHTTKKMDYIPGMPSSDYKKMKEAPTTEVAKEESTTEETTEDTTVATTKKTSTEPTTQAPKETPTEQPKETPTEQPTEAPTEAPTQPSTEAPKEEDHGARVEGNTYYGHYETKTETYTVYGYRAYDGTFFEDCDACIEYAMEHNLGYGDAEETRTREVQVWVWDR